MKFGVVIPTWGDYWAQPNLIRNAVQAVEDLGFNGAWFGDHVVVPEYAIHLSPPQWYDALACMGIAAGATDNIRLGTDVLVLPYRNPLVLSQFIASLDQLSGGRVTLGIGVGYISGEFQALGAPPYERRGAVTDEYIEVMRLLWESTDGASYAGEWNSFESMYSGPAPAQSPLPLWIGGNGRSAWRRAARYGDGWHPLFPLPEDYRQGRAAIEKYRSEGGRQGPMTFSMSCKRSRLVLQSGEHVPPLSARRDVPDEYKYSPAPPKTADGRERFVGSVGDVLQDVADYRDAGVDHILLRFWNGEPNPQFSEWLEQARRFSRYVLPEAEQ